MGFGLFFATNLYDIRASNVMFDYILPIFLKKIDEHFIVVRNGDDIKNYTTILNVYQDL